MESKSLNGSNGITLNIGFRHPDILEGTRSHEGCLCDYDSENYGDS